MRIKRSSTYYVVAHFHYVLSMGAIYALFAAFYYWVGKITGFQYSEKLGLIHLTIFTIAINLVFFFMHLLGLAGLPRRYPDFPDAYNSWGPIMTVGSFLTVISVFYFLYIVSNLFNQSRYTFTNRFVSI